MPTFLTITIALALLQVPGIEAQVGFWIKIIAENILAGFMIWLYLKDRKQWQESRKELYNIIKHKDEELAALNASINTQVIDFLRAVKNDIQNHG